LGDRWFVTAAQEYDIVNFQGKNCTENLHSPSNMAVKQKKMKNTRNSNADTI